MKRIIGYILITIVSILSFFQLLQTMKIVFGSFSAYLWFIAGIVCFFIIRPFFRKMKHGSPLSPMNWPTPLQAYWCSTRCTPWKCTNKREARNIWEEATSSLHWHPIASPSSLISSYCWCFSVPYALYAFSNFLSGWHWDSTYFASPSKPTLTRQT